MANSDEMYKQLYAESGEINHLELEESILDQPQKFGHCAAWCAHYHGKRDRAERDAKITDAGVARRIRDEWGGDKKPTEAMVAEAVMVDDESQAAWDRYHKAKELAAKWDAVLQAFKQRSYSLTQYANWRSGDYIHERVGSGGYHRGRVRQ